MDLAFLEYCDIACVYAAQFSQEDTFGDTFILSGCSRYNEAKMFNLNSEWMPCCTMAMKQGIFSVDFGNRKNIFAYGGTDKTVHLRTLKQR